MNTAGAGNRIITVETLARGQLLGQLAPADTTAAALVTAAVRTEITTLIIANVTGTAATCRVFHDEAGTTYALGNALLYDVSVPANTTLFVEAGSAFAGLTLQATDTLGVRTGTANALTFSAYGTRETAR